jgi:hypothetical protein
MDVDDRVRYPTIEITNWYGRMSKEFPAFWGILVEKAWAKSFSNYKSLGKGGYST